MHIRKPNQHPKLLLEHPTGSTLWPSHGPIQALCGVNSILTSYVEIFSRIGLKGLAGNGSFLVLVEKGRQENQRGREKNASS